MLRLWHKQYGNHSQSGQSVLNAPATEKIPALAYFMSTFPFKLKTYKQNTESLKT